MRITDTLGDQDTQPTASQRGTTPMVKAVYRRLKRPARALRNRYHHRLVRRMLTQAIKQTDYSWADLERLPAYLDHSFQIRKPEYPQALQRPYRYYPQLDAQPIWNPERFDFVDTLLNGRDRILEELGSYREERRLAIHHQGLNKTGKWNVCYLFAAGEKSEESKLYFPETTRMLEGIPGMGVVGQAYFSVLAPGTHIPAHCGPTNVRLRLQLALEMPKGCQMRIGDRIHDWDEGHQVLVFDDSFEHEVWIRAASERIVLILDFWHPDLSAAERWALTAIDQWMPDRRHYKTGVKRGR